MLENKTDKLDLLIALAARDAAQDDLDMLASLDTSTVVFDKDYERKKRATINQICSRPNIRKLKYVGVRVAVALLSLILLAALVIGCVPPVRDAFIEAVVEWYDNYFTIRFETPNNPQNGGIADTDETESQTYDTETSTTDETESQTVETTEETTAKEPPKTIETIRKPTALPEGIEEDMYLANDSLVGIDYYLNGEYVIAFSQHLLENSDKYYDSDSATITEIRVNNYPSMLIEFTDKSEIAILWNDEEYIYMILSEFYDAEQLLVFAESVK